MPRPHPIRKLQFVFHPEQDSNYEHFKDADQHPFVPEAAGMVRVNAWWLAEAALLSYWDPGVGCERLRAAGLTADFIAEEGVECYLGSGKDHVLIAFRGTEPDQWRDILDDALFLPVVWREPGTLVHAGFKGSFARIWPHLKAKLDQLAPRKAWFTGHSLGAALATLAAAEFERTAGLCTLGSPRVGNRAFRTRLETQLGPHLARYVYEADVVTHVPPEAGVYEHVGQLRRIRRSDGEVEMQPATQWHHYFSDLIGQGSQLLDLVHLLQPAHILKAPDFLLDHMPRGYSIEIWNDYEAHRS
jgi:triacylglycerol lipase